MNLALTQLIDVALQEDLGTGDITTEAIFAPSRKGQANLVAKEDLVLSGLEVVRQVFCRLDPACSMQCRHKEGQRMRRGQKIARLSGPVRALLSGERTALNFLRHLCGIATLTRHYVEAIHGTRCRLLDTRKTTPGMRVVEKAAVRAGGAFNHRMNLADGVMLKDNHIQAAGSIHRAVQKVRKRIPPTIKIEVECDTLRQVRAALTAGADIIMLDNMSLPRMAQALQVVKGKALIEASGNVNLDTIRPIAELGVDYVSVGAITHSARQVDIGMDWQD